MSRLTVCCVLAFSVSACSSATAPPSPPPPELSDATVAQLDRLFSSVTEVQREYEALLTQAKYPTEETKTSAKQWIKLKQFLYEDLRVRYLECSQKRTRRTLVEFLEVATGFVDVPKSTFTHWDVKTGTQELANLSRTESLRDDFYVMSIALLKDVK